MGNRLNQSTSSKEICKKFQLEHFGNKVDIFWPSTESSPKENSFLFLNKLNDKTLRVLSEKNPIFLIIPPRLESQVSNLDFGYCISDDPRSVFFQILEYLYSHLEKSLEDFIDPSAHIGNEVEIGKNVHISKGCFIEGPCTIGDNVYISPNCLFLGKVEVGNNCFFSSSVVIGEEALSLREENGLHKANLQIGGVKIGQSCRLGLKSSVSRGTIEDTQLGNNVHIAENVLIAHNVVVGDNTVITVNTTVCGSGEVSENCWLGPKSLIMSHVKIPMNTKIAAGAVVHTNIKKPGTYMGNPAKLLKIK